MSATGAQGEFSFGPQASKGTPPTGYYRHRALSVGLSINDPVQIGPIEVGGIDIPTFPYKTGPMGAGSVALQPRLEDTFGWLLYGLTGSVASALSTVDNYDHVFEVAAADSPVPFMGFRKHIPRVNAGPGTDLGEVFTDAKLLSCGFNFPNMQPVTSELGIASIHAEMDHSPDAWTYENTFEDWQSIPLTCTVGGSLTVDGNAMSVIGASVQVANSPLPVQQERIAFSPYMDDITIVQRSVSFDLMLKWNNPDIYAKLYSGSALGTGWTATPFTAPLDLTVLSSSNMPSSTPEPYRLNINAPSVSFTQVGDIELAGGQSIMLRLRGTALANASHYAKFTLRNMVSAYAWPV